MNYPNPTTYYIKNDDNQYTFKPLEGLDFGYRFNGWNIPFFTLEQFQKAKITNKKELIKLGFLGVYNSSKDCFECKSEDGIFNLPCFTHQNIKYYCIQDGMTFNTKNI
jgi:hypothetical protein